MTNNLDPKPFDLMLADDDDEEVIIFQTALDRQEGKYELRHAKDENSLFILLKEKVPYMLFLDINMAKSDGIACLQRIRTIREYDMLPVVIYTSFLGGNNLEASYRAGANHYLQKTGSIEELSAKLAKLFSIDWAHFLHYPPRDQYEVT